MASLVRQGNLLFEEAYWYVSTWDVNGERSASRSVKCVSRLKVMSCTVHLGKEVTVMSTVSSQVFATSDPHQVRAHSLRGS